jgi:hypothetical protein
MYQSAIPATEIVNEPRYKRLVVHILNVTLCVGPGEIPIDEDARIHLVCQSEI